MQLAGLRVDEVGGEGAGIAAEQRVRERAVTPVETGGVQPNEQCGQRVEQAPGRVRAQGRGEQRAVGQRELQVPGDQRRVERLAGLVLPPCHDTHRLDRGDLPAVELAKQSVLPASERLADLLDCVDSAAEPHETHDVADMPPAV